MVSKLKPTDVFNLRHPPVGHKATITPPSSVPILIRHSSGPGQF